MIEITFTHSLNLSPVTDVIEFTGSELILRKSMFKTFGAGIPVPSDSAGTELVKVDGHYELIGIDKRIEGLAIMTQDIPDHRITLNGREAFLLKLAEPGKSVNVGVARVPAVMRIVLMLRS